MKHSGLGRFQVMRKEIKETLTLGWPIMLGNITQMLLGVIDSAMVGYIHSSQLAASSFVNNLITVPMILGMGMTMAIAPLVASARGGDDYDKPMEIAFNGFILSGVLVLVMAIAIHFGTGITHVMGQDEIVADLSGPYLRWMAWGMLPMVLFMAIKQFSDGLGLTRWPMYLSLASLPINGFLNYLFIYGKLGIPRMELEGAGIATTITRAFLLVAMAALVLWQPAFAPYRQNLRAKLRWSAPRAWEMARIGIPSALQFSMEAGAFAFSGLMAGWLGYIQQAAHQIVLNVASTTFMVSLGISAAGTIRVAHADGKGDRKLVRGIGYSTLVMAGVYGLFCAILLLAGQHLIPSFFNREAPVLSYAAGLMLLAGIFQISDSTQAVGVGLLRGLQDVRWPTVFVALAYWGIGIPVGYVLAFPLNWQVNGLWVGFIVGLSSSALLLFFRFRRLVR
jgi:MATE family multidrug resistance protein